MKAGDTEKTQNTIFTVPFFKYRPQKIDKELGTGRGATNDNTRMEG